MGVATDGSPVTLPLPDGMTVTILSPHVTKLQALKGTWDGVVEEFGAADEDALPVDAAPDAIDGLEAFVAIDVEKLATGKLTEHDAVANGSSIALLLSYKDKSALFLADAHPSLVLKRPMAHSPAEPLRTDWVKLSHHGEQVQYEP